MKQDKKEIKKYQIKMFSLISIIIILIGIVVGKITSANAEEENAYAFRSEQVTYDKTNSNLNSEDVQNAIDELYGKIGQCPKGYKCTKPLGSVKKYDETSGSSTFCINGDEATCVAETCIENGTTCPVGTIIDYNVNDSETVRFHVLHDNGSTITMQSQRTTVYNTAWNSSNSISGGPITIMAALKTATDGWSNVKDITFTNGMTTYAEDNVSAINKCSSYNSCSGSLYQYSTIVNTIGNNGVMKARMITMQEATDRNIGMCTTSDKSCLMFMSNFLYDSANSIYCKVAGKCTNDQTGGANYAYWTMAAASSSYAWFVDCSGLVDYYFPRNTSYGARAVVVIDK